MKAKFHLRPITNRSWILFREGTHHPVEAFQRCRKGEAVQKAAALLEGTGAHLIIYRINGTFGEELVFDAPTPQMISLEQNTHHDRA